MAELPVIATRRAAYLPGLTPQVRRRLELTIAALTGAAEDRESATLLYLMRDLSHRETVLKTFLEAKLGIEHPHFHPAQEAQTDFLLLIGEEA